MGYRSDAVEDVEKGRDNTGTFVINIKGSKNHTWQGSIRWLEGKAEKNFRSTLEMLSLMGDVLDPSDEDGRNR